MSLSLTANDGDPKLAVVTPVFNGAQFLEATLESVMAALPEGGEYVVVDDGSTDCTPEILKAYAPRIRVLRQENSGEASAVNRGVAAVPSADYVVVVNADDLISSDFFACMTDAIAGACDHPVVFYPDWTIIDEDGTCVENIRTPDYSLTRLLQFFQCLPGPGSVFSRSAFLAVGGRSSSFRFVSDYDLWLRMSQEGPFQRVPEVLASWRFHQDGASAVHAGLEMARERIAVVDQHLARIGPEVEGVVDVADARANALYHAALLSVRSPGVPGRRYLAKALRISRGLPSQSDPLIVASIFFSPLPRIVNGIARRFGWRLMRTKRGVRFVSQRNR